MYKSSQELKINFNNFYFHILINMTITCMFNNNKFKNNFNTYNNIFLELF